MDITTSSLQSLINKKAEEKARADIKVLIKALSDSGILQIKGFALEENGKPRDLMYCLSDNSFNKKDNILTVLYDEKVAKYIISETESFVSKVEKLSEEADRLLNIAENL